MVKVALVSSAGGHLTEILAIASGLKQKHELFACVTGFKVVRRVKLPEIKKLYPFPVFLNYSVPLGVMVSLLWSLFVFIKVFRKERPDFIITTGAEIAIPALVINKLFFRCPSLYIESVARIDTPSLTGKIVSRLVDKVFVQWPDVAKFYAPKAEYHGRLV